MHKVQAIIPRASQVNVHKYMFWDDIKESEIGLVYERRKVQRSIVRERLALLSRATDRREPPVKFKSPTSCVIFLFLFLFLFPCGLASTFRLVPQITPELVSTLKGCCWRKLVWWEGNSYHISCTSYFWVSWPISQYGNCSRALPLLTL